MEAPDAHWFTSPAMFDPDDFFPTMTKVATRRPKTTRTTWWNVSLPASEEPCDNHNPGENTDIPRIGHKGAAGSLYDNSPSSDSSSASQGFTLTPTPPPPTAPVPPIETTTSTSTFTPPWISISTSAASVASAPNDVSSGVDAGDFRPPVSMPSEAESVLETSVEAPASTISSAESVPLPLPMPSASHEPKVEPSTPVPAPTASPPEPTPIVVPPQITTASDPTLSSAEATTVGPAVQSDPTTSHAANITQTSTPSCRHSEGDKVTLPVGAFAAILAVAGLLAVILLLLAIIVWRRRRRRQADAHPEVDEHPRSGTLTPLKDYAQQDGGHDAPLEAGLADNDGSASMQTLREGDKVRLSVFPGWLKRIAQFVTGRERKNDHVDFEMVTGDQAAR